MSVQLKDAINNANTFENLRLLAEKLDAGYDFCGRSFLIAKPEAGIDGSAYTGEASIDALLDRALKIIHQNRPLLDNCPENSPERGASELLDREITRIYRMDEKNEKESCIITKIIVAVKLFFSCICCNYESRHRWWNYPRWPQYEDYGNIIYSGYGEHILAPYIPLFPPP